MVRRPKQKWEEKGKETMQTFYINLGLNEYTKNTVLENVSTLLKNHEYVTRKKAATDAELRSFVSAVIFTDPKVKQHISARKIQIMEKETFDKTEADLDEWIHRQFDWWVKQRLKTLRMRSKRVKLERETPPAHTKVPLSPPANHDAGDLAISIPATPTSGTALKVKRKSNLDDPDNRPSKKNCIKLGSVRNELIKEGQDVVDDLVEEPDDIFHQRQEPVFPLECEEQGLLEQLANHSRFPPPSSPNFNSTSGGSLTSSSTRFASIGALLTQIDSTVSPPGTVPVKSTLEDFPPHAHLAPSKSTATLTSTIPASPTSAKSVNSTTLEKPVNDNDNVSQSQLIRTQTRSPLSESPGDMPPSSEDLPALKTFRTMIQKGNQNLEEEIGRLKEINARRKQEIKVKVWKRVCEDWQRRKELKAQLVTLKNVSYSDEDSD